MITTWLPRRDWSPVRPSCAAAGSALAEDWFRAALKLDPGLIQAHRELIYIYGMQLRRARAERRIHGARQTHQPHV